MVNSSTRQIIFLLSIIIILFCSNQMIVEANQNPLNVELYRQHETDLFPESREIKNHPDQSSDEGLTVKSLSIPAGEETNEVSIIQFNDDGLIEAICSSIGKPVGDISCEDLLSLTSLDASDYDIGDLTGLEYAKNLVSLDLSQNQISNITPLSSLTQLQYLDLSQNQLTNLSALSNLANLILIDLDGNQVNDISYVNNLTNLKGLYLDKNQIIDINVLSSLSQLQILGLGDNQISDISPLSNLTALQYLNLPFNNIGDISPLSNLTNLKGLYLWENSITSITALARLVNLNYLYLDGNSLSDISVLSNLTKLQDLGLGYNQISDISCLRNLTNLETLYLYNNSITDITALSYLTQLDELDLYENQIVDISPLLVNSNSGGLSEGDWIDLRLNPLGDQALLDVQTLQSRGIRVEVNAEAATPTTNIQSGKVPRGTQISLSCSTSGASIFYTTDGTAPTTLSTLYIGPITIAEDTIIKAMAAKTDMRNSSIMTAVYTISNTPQNISDAVLDPDYPIIYMTSKTEKRLYATNYLTGEFKTIDFVAMPESLEIGKGEYANELYVALLKQQHSSYWWEEDQSGKIAVFDRQDFSLKDTIEIQIDPYDIVAGRDGCLYIPSGSGQFTNFDSYDRRTKQRIGRSGIRQMSPAKLHPTLDRIYTVTTDSSPRDYTAYNISDGIFTDPVYSGGYGSPYHGDYPLNTYFVIDPAGEYLYNGSGVIFSTTQEKANDMKYVGKLGDTFNSIVFEANSSRFYTLKTGNKQVSTYASFSYEKLLSRPIEGEGQCLFKQGNKLIVLVKNQPDLTYNIELIDIEEELPVTDVTIDVSPQSPLTAGSTISLSAGSSGGNNPEYRFWVKEATDVWKIVQNWSVNTSCMWIPQISGKAELRVEARSTGAIGAQISKTISYTVNPGVLQGAWLMPSTVSDAVADSDNPIIYMTNKKDKRLYAVNYLNGDTVVLGFKEMPESLEIGKGEYSSELYVALLSREHSDYWWKEDQSGKIAVFDRQDFNLKDTIEIQIDPYDIVAGRDGCLYIPSGSGQWTNFDSYNRSTKQRIGRSGIRQMCHAQLHPTLDSIYTMTTESSPSDYKAYNISNGTFSASYDSPYHGDYPLNTYFAIDPAGKHLYNGSGVIFITDPEKSNDMKYVGKIDQGYNGIAFDSDASAFYILPFNKSLVDVYDASTNLQIEAIPINGPGKYIFKQGADLIVLFQKTNQAGSLGMQVINLNQAAQVQVPMANPASGSFTGSINITLSTNTAGAEIYYTTDGSIPTTASTLYTGSITVSKDTTIKAIATKTDMINSYIMTASYSQIQAAAPTANPSAGAVTVGTQITLATATPDASIYYTTNGSIPTTASTLYTGPITISAATTIKAVAMKSGMKNSSVITASYTIGVAQAATPTANPGAGPVSIGTQVTLATATLDASIYYTTDGSIPTIASTLYTGPITISAATTIKAVAMKSGMKNSSVITVYYTIDVARAATPTANPGAGQVTIGTQVTLTTAATGASIYYTTDGSIPTTASTLYIGPITVNTALTIKAIAVKDGMTNSLMMIASYTVAQAAAPTANPGAGPVSVGTQVTLTTATTGASIYYTTDGSTPTIASTIYTTPITISSVITIRAIAVKTGLSNSTAVSFSYTIAQTIAINIPDPNLLSVLRSALGKTSGDITNIDMQTLTELWANSRDIKNLSGLQYAINLKSLFLYNNQITDISALSTLNNLQTLYLYNNQIKDISLLDSLVSLQYLMLNNNRITDITALGSLAKLRSVEMCNNQLSNISALRNLTNLGSLSLDNNQIIDISPLVQNSGMAGSSDYLGLKGNPLSVQAFADIQTLRNRGVSVYCDAAPVIIPPDDPSETLDECFIATAAFGSKLEPQVVLLRNFRDKYLLTWHLGKEFVNFYYHNSPPIARYIKHNELLKGLVRILLLPLIAAAYFSLHPVIGIVCTILLVVILFLWKKRRMAIAILPK